MVCDLAISSGLFSHMVGVADKRSNDNFCGGCRVLADCSFE